MSMAEIKFGQQGQLGLVYLNRPQSLNALTLNMIHDLQAQLLDWEKDDEIKAVVVQAVPGKAFCAGGDIRWLYEMGKEHRPEQIQFFWHEYRLNHYISQYSKPYIALMDGITMGGGVGISLHGTFPVATENFIFAMPETGIGFFPDIGACYHLARCPGALGRYLGLTGEKLNALQAKAAKLIRYVMRARDIPIMIAKLAQLDYANQPNVQVSQVLEKYCLSGNEPFPHEEKIQYYFNNSNLFTIMAALETADDEWAKQCLATLQQKAPLSLMVTQEQILKAWELSLGECVQMDYCLVKHFMKDHDFYEGVRALIIDKDKRPEWQPKDITMITPEMVSRYFLSTEAVLPLLRV